MLELPLEILLMIIKYIPSERKSNAVAEPASSFETKALHSCLFLRKGAVPDVQRELYRHHLYINSARKLHALVRSYETSHGLGLTMPEKIAASTGLYLAPCGRNPRYHAIISDIVRLFTLVGRALRDLVVDIPLHMGSSLAVDISDFLDQLDQLVQCPTPLVVSLRSGFEQLTAIESLVSVQDQLYFHPPGVRRLRPLWSYWMGLERITLYNQFVDDELVESLTFLPKLSQVVLVDIDVEFYEDWPDMLSRLGPNVRVVLLESWKVYKRNRFIRGHREQLQRLATSSQIGGARIRYIGIRDAMTDNGFAMTVDGPLQFWQGWVLSAATRGGLWDGPLFRLPQTGELY